MTTSDTYISLAAAAPPVMAASTAPTRTRSSDGSDDQVVTENLRSPDARSGQPSAAACRSERRRSWGSRSLRGRVREAGSIEDVACVVGCDHEMMGSRASTSRAARIRARERRIARAKRRWPPSSGTRGTPKRKLPASFPLRRRKRHLRRRDARRRPRRRQDHSIPRRSDATRERGSRARRRRCACTASWCHQPLLGFSGQLLEEKATTGLGARELYARATRRRGEQSTTARADG